MSLLEPWYLLGLLGLALPWLLHRFSHHEPPEQVFPTTRFLEPTTPPATSKRKLRYWLLLALRLLFLIALCLLFAQPWLRSLNDAADSEAVQLIVVDTSFSMRAEDRWQKASDTLERTLDELPEGDAVQLFSYAGQLTAQTDITNDRALLNSAISQLSPGYESADFGELMRRLDKVAGEIDKPVSATFISDAQRSNLPVQMNTLLANQLREFTVESVQGTPPLNYYLRANAITADTVNARVSVTASAASLATTGLATDGSEGITEEQKTVQISMNGRVLATQDVLLAPGESKPLQFDKVSLPSDIESLMQVSFELKDFLPDDDMVEIPVRGLSAMDVVLTSIGGDIDEQARVFVTTALETDGDAKAEIRDANSALAPSVRHVIAFIDNPQNIPDTINRFVADGGNALVIPRVASSSGNTGFNADALSVSTVDLPHALALGDINWFETRFYDVPEFDMSDNDRLLLGFGPDQPLLVERVGDGQNDQRTDGRTGGAASSQFGRLLILNDALDGFNSDFPLQPAFVQLMQSIMAYFTASNALPTELQVGRDLFLPASTQLLSPNGDEMLELDQLGAVNHVRIDEPGVYTVLGANSSDSVSVVLNAAESNLLGLSQEELDAWQSRHDANNTALETANDASDDSAEQATASNLINRQLQDTQGLWRWLIPVVLIFLLVESMLANRLLWVRRDGL